MSNVLKYLLKTHVNIFRLKYVKEYMLMGMFGIRTDTFKPLF